MTSTHAVQCALRWSVLGSHPTSTIESVEHLLPWWRSECTQTKTATLRLYHRSASATWCHFRESTSRSHRPDLPRALAHEQSIDERSDHTVWACEAPAILRMIAILRCDRTTDRRRQAIDTVWTQCWAWADWRVATTENEWREWPQRASAVCGWSRCTAMSCTSHAFCCPLDWRIARFRSRQAHLLPPHVDPSYSAYSLDSLERCDRATTTAVDQLSSPHRRLELWHLMEHRCGWSRSSSRVSWSEMHCRWWWMLYSSSRSEIENWCEEWRKSGRSWFWLSSIKVEHQYWRAIEKIFVRRSMKVSNKEEPAVEKCEHQRSTQLRHKYSQNKSIFLSMLAAD